MKKRLLSFIALTICTFGLQSCEFAVILIDFLMSDLDVYEDCCSLTIENKSDSMIVVCCYMESDTFYRERMSVSKDSVWTCFFGTAYVNPGARDILYTPGILADSVDWQHFFENYCIDSISVLIGKTAEDLNLWNENHDSTLLLERIDMKLDDMNRFSRDQLIQFPSGKK